MNKYVVNMMLVDDMKQKSFIGYEGMKRSELISYFEDKLKAKNLFIGKKNTIVDAKDNYKGSYGVESIAV